MTLGCIFSVDHRLWSMDQNRVCVDCAVYPYSTILGHQNVLFLTEISLGPFFLSIIKLGKMKTHQVAIGKWIW